MLDDKPLMFIDSVEIINNRINPIKKEKIINNDVLKKLNDLLLKYQSKILKVCVIKTQTTEIEGILKNITDNKIILKTKDQEVEIEISDILECIELKI